MTSKTAETPEAILKRLSRESKKLDDLMLEKRKVKSGNCVLYINIPVTSYSELLTGLKHGACLDRRFY